MKYCSFDNNIEKDFFNAITEIYGLEKTEAKLKNKILEECTALHGNPKY